MRPAIAILVLLVFPLRHGFAQSEPTAAPNVLVIITDDQGYGDVSAHGNEMLETPSLDRLLSESVQLSDFHVDPTCSPTRSAVMSGRSSTRTGVWHTIMGRSLMHPDETTMAEAFRAAGYRTGMFGKWHLGDNYPCRPQDQGFEHVVWHHGGGVGQGPDHWGNDYFDDTYEVNGTEHPFEGYCTDVWFEEATRFVDAADDERPFFAYLATNAPHGPFLVADEWADPYRKAGVPETMARFYGMIANIDANLGRLMDHLATQGLAENTIVVFLTDNGTARGHAKPRREEGTWQGFNAGMRGNKGSQFEGGHRVPCSFRWPAGGIGGDRAIDTLSAHFDLLPTLADLARVEFEPRGPLDGVSLADLLRDPEAAPPQRTLVVHSQRIEHPRKWRKSAVMTERYRLIDGEQLYDILADPSQQSDVAAANPEIVSQLRAHYDAWWDSLAPAIADTVHIGLGGDENPTRLMSHDWHTEDQGVPWHQNHVKNGYVGNGPWAVELLRAGTYEFELRRWPAQLERAMDCIHASVGIAGNTAEIELAPTADVARFTLELSAGKTELRTTLRREDGTEHGAYYCAVRYRGSERR